MKPDLFGERIDPNSGEVLSEREHREGRDRSGTDCLGLDLEERGTRNSDAAHVRCCFVTQSYGMNHCELGVVGLESGQLYSSLAAEVTGSA